MSEPIVQLTANDFEDAMDFLNLVFSVHGPHDFARLLPKVYRPTDEHMQHNYAIKRNGRIRAMVGLFPMTLVIGGTFLKLAGIGGVSSHPNDRGMGHMKRLMQHCVEVMKADNYQLSWLDGQRQRYGYFGYETCGQRISANFEKANIKHLNYEPDSVQFIKVDKNDLEWLRHINVLHENQPIHVRRSAHDFYHFATSWKSSLYIAVEDQTHILGYLIYQHAQQKLTECVAVSKTATERMLHAWISASENEPWWVNIPPIQHDVFAAITSICEFPQVTPLGCWQIFDWPRVLSATLALKNQYSDPMDGSVTVEIPKVGTLLLEVREEKVSCQWVSNEPDLTLDSSTAMRLFFGPLSASSVAHLPGSAKILEAWCPLPLYLSRPDWV